MGLGGLITAAALLPNLLLAFFKAKGGPPAQTTEKDWRTVLIEGLERAGQAGCFIVPFFYSIQVESGLERASLAALALLLIFYYAGWARFFAGGREFALLYQPILGIPIPMAAAPVLYFLSAAVLLHSWLLAGAAILLAVGHLTVSWTVATRIKVNQAGART